MCLESLAKGGWHTAQSGMKQCYGVLVVSLQLQGQYQTARELLQQVKHVSEVS